MEIYRGLLVKSRRDRIVKLQRETAPGYWLCNDERIRVVEDIRDQLAKFRRKANSR